jgi:hypothetical protein
MHGELRLLESKQPRLKQVIEPVLLVETPRGLSPNWNYSARLATPRSTGGLALLVRTKA